MNLPSHVGSGSLIGVPYRKLLGQNFPKNQADRSLFKQNVWIGNNCSIGVNVNFDEGVIVDHGCSVESSVIIGFHTLVTYRCLICSESVIGKRCVIGGFIGERTKIGDNCQIFGDIVHQHLNPLKGWDSPSSMERAANISDMVFMGFGSKVTKAIEIGNNVYICANALVSKDVPPYHIVTGINQMTHYSDWRGELKKSHFFKG